MNTFIRTMILATAVLLAPVAEAAAVKAKAPVAAKSHKVSRNAKAEPLRGYVYSPKAVAAVMQPLPAIAGIQPAQLPKPPPAPGFAQTNAEGDLARISALMQQCNAAMPAAHPWRAAQANREMFQLKVSMSYRAAAHRLSEQERASAVAIEARAFGNLAATCAPLLV